jgi:alpha-beta hydrolase superfamily lysophospholipase
MQQGTGTFKSADGLDIHTIHWLPDRDPRAIVLILHGIGEHSGRYQHVAEQFTSQGYAVYSLDYRGHGHSDGPRSYFNSFDEPVADVYTYVQQIETDWLEKQIFIYGHSMGALIAFLFALRHQAHIAGIISTGVPLTLDELAPGIAIRVANGLARVAPRLALFPLNEKHLARDPEVGKAYRADPLVYQGRQRVGMVTRMIARSNEVKAELMHLRVPLLILHGGADKICPVSGSQYIFDHAGSPDKRLEIYPGQYHELHNEPEKYVTLGDITTWLADHVRSEPEA